MDEIRVARPTDAQAAEAAGWPIWTCDVSTFDWHYDQQETCLLLEGEVTVTAGEQRVSFGPGDWVVFPEGLSCVWQVTSPVRKHYKFG